MQAIPVHSNCLGGQGGRFSGSFPGNTHQMLQAACPYQGAVEVRINTWEPLGSFGSGKEHKLRCFSGLVWWYLLDPTKKPISAKGVHLYPSDPASGQYFHVDHLQGQTESQHVAGTEWLPWPVMGPASLVMDISQRRTVLDSPILGLPSSPQGRRFVHALHAVCLWHAGPCARTLKSITTILSTKRINKSNHHHHQMQAAH